ncbi:MAG: hypothetical protein PHU61_01330 [Candidatus Absconditabacteria bacterium]|nr:hypothetical protein [Candidatus Absconditabacteria bacterium]MDD3868058.1 hypothetical protein [Candidatus Absconditabacteria bacterium]MDD4714305.1 hypothetical protein [Candidatus Absconditabacteria bacterium]
MERGKFIKEKVIWMFPNEYLTFKNGYVEKGNDHGLSVKISEKNLTALVKDLVLLTPYTEKVTTLFQNHISGIKLKKGWEQRAGIIQKDIHTLWKDVCEGEEKTEEEITTLLSGIELW